MHKLLLLVFLAASVSCAQEIEIPENLQTDESRKFLKTEDGKSLLANAKEKALAEQRSYQNDPVLQDYFDFYGRGNYNAAFQSIEPVAMAGHAQAQAELASLYLNGKGVPVDVDLAIKWLEKSSAQGNLMATSTLAGIYYVPNLGRQDFDKSYEYNEKCALLLRYSCLVPYANLQAVEGLTHYDLVKAAAWYEIAVDQDAPGASLNQNAVLSQLTKDQLAQVKIEKKIALALIEKNIKQKATAK